MRYKTYYVIQAYNPGDPGYLASARVRSRRSARRIFGTFRSRFPHAMTTLNRREPVLAFDGYGQSWTWKTTTHHHIEGK